MSITLYGNVLIKCGQMMFTCVSYESPQVMNVSKCLYVYTCDNTSTCTHTREECVIAVTFTCGVITISY